MLTPEMTFAVLLVVQAAHLLHHRLARRHISFVEVAAAVVLCVPLSIDIPRAVLMTVHLALASIQIVGSLFIDKLSPKHGPRGPLASLG